MKKFFIRAFWKRVRSLLKKRAVSQDMAARAIGVHPSTFRSWISRERIPPLSFAFMLAQYLGVNINYLISGYDADKNAVKKEEVLNLLEKAGDKLRYL